MLHEFYMYRKWMVYFVIHATRCSRSGSNSGVFIYVGSRREVVPDQGHVSVPELSVHWIHCFWVTRFTLRYIEPMFQQCDCQNLLESQDPFNALGYGPSVILLSVHLLHYRASCGTSIVVSEQETVRPLNELNEEQRLELMRLYAMTTSMPSKWQAPERLLKYCTRSHLIYNSGNWFRD